MPISGLKETILSHAAAVLCLSPEEIPDNRRLADLGMDSIIGVELINRLNKEFGMSLKKSVLYDYPTIHQLTAFIHSETAETPGSEPEPVEQTSSVGADAPDDLYERMEAIISTLPSEVLERFQSPAELADYILSHYHEELFVSQEPDSYHLPEGAIAVVGMSGRYPGAGDLDEFWRNLRDGRNCIGQIPEYRWDYRDYFDPDREAVGKTYSKWGGFIDGVDLFDPLFFNISPREAVVMDPQVRLMLETVWNTLEDAGYTRRDIDHLQANRKRAGIFIGCMYNQYAFLARDERIGETLSNMSYWSIVNRCSYFFNFKGPSIAIDTACSSSLSAIHMACENIRSGACEIAVAGGVNLSLHPGKYLVLKEIGLLGSGGKSKSLGDGDGYIPGEGVGAVLLRPLASAVGNGDHIYGVIRASSVNHGGQTEGFTLPNPDAQAELIEEVLEKSGIHPEEIGYVEASATGSPVGDVGEINGLSTVFKKWTDRVGFCFIGSVKANVGHLEAAAGIAQFTKVMLQLYHKSIVPSINADPLNPQINLEESPFTLPLKPVSWETVGPRRAAVNSFGAGGSNAHMIVEEYRESAPLSPRKQGTRLFVLSARKSESLVMMARRLVEFLIDSPVDLDKMAFTLQCGREEMQERLALVAETKDELLAGLTAFCEGADPGANVFRGSIPDDQPPVPVVYELQDAGADLAALARKWVEGALVDWLALYPQGTPGKVSLPTYPFMRKRYWIDSKLESAGHEGQKKIREIPLPQIAGGDATHERDYKSEVRGVVASVLSLEPPEVKDRKRFMELGMDSILGVEFIKKLNAVFNVNLKATVLYDYSTVEAMAGFLRGTGAPINENVPAQLTHATPGASESVTCRGFLIDGIGDVAGARMADIDVFPPAEGEVQIQVVASALNFADILCVKGLYPTMPDYPFVAGFQAAGIVTRTGPGATRFSQGDRVVAMTGFPLGGHAEFVNTHEGLVAHKPDNVGFVDMCGFPDAFVTAYYCLYEIGRLEPGEHVLIQSAAGAVGLMAVQLAKAREAVVIGTASSNEKLDYLKSIGVDYVINYMQEDFFERVMEISGNRGVDIVLNTLSGDAIQKGIDCLAEEGRYLEIAVAGLRASDKLDFSNMTGNQSFHGIDLRKLWRNYSKVRQYLDVLVDMVGRGMIKPIVFKRFPADRIAEALHYIESRKSIGKVALVFADEEQVTVPSKYSGKQMDIAVVGMSGRFPGASDIWEFWSNLAGGVDCVEEVPPHRWDVQQYYDPDISAINKTNSRWCGCLDDVDRFDPLFFNITPMEAELMDPQQRLFLEEAWKAIEDAGYSPHDLSGAACGVFVGAGPGDYSINTLSMDYELNTYSLLGSINSIMSGRISYFLNLLGPNIAVDTACSSSLVAAHLACLSIAAGESEIALAGGVNVMTTPVMHIMVGKADLLSPAGKCRAFDNNADGLVPGEGVGVVVLKPLPRAREDRDHIYGVIAASGVNQDGQTNGITAPSMESQVRLETGIYDRFGIQPEQIGYVEAHGTGTKLGDPIELEALVTAFGKFTGKKRFCAIGSVKSNIGHGLASAGIAGLMKTLLCLQHRQLVPSLHFETPNEHFDFEHSPFFVNTNLDDWAVNDGQSRMAAISSFGFSGTNAHVVLKERPMEPPRQSNESEHYYLIVMSAKSSDSLTAGARRLSLWVREYGPRLDLRDISFTLLAGRTHFARRIGFVVRDIDQLKEQLDHYLDAGFTAFQQPRRGDEAPVDRGEALIRQLNGCWAAEGELDRQKTLMMELAQLYVDGLDTNWYTLFEHCDARRISLPTYSFAAERYWRPDPLEKKDSEQQGLSRRLDLDWSFVLEDSAGMKHVTGLFFLEAARLLGETFTGQPVGRLTNVVWGRPLFWRASPPECFIDMLRVPGGGVAFEVNNGRRGEHCRVFAQGKFASNDVGGNGKKSGATPPVLPLLEDLKKDEGKKYGKPEQLRYLRQIQRNGTEAVARMTLSLGWACLANGLIEALTVLSGEEAEWMIPALFPLSLETILFKGVPDGDVYLHICSRNGRDAGFGPGHYDISVYSETKELLIFFKNLSIRPDRIVSQMEPREGV